MYEPQLNPSCRALNFSAWEDRLRLLREVADHLFRLGHGEAHVTEEVRRLGRHLWVGWDSTNGAIAAAKTESGYQAKDGKA